MKLKELAEQLGVSAASISIVRQGREGVGAATRRRIQLALEQNGVSYIPLTPGTRIPEPIPAPPGEGRRIRLLKHFSTALLTDKNEGFVTGIIETAGAFVRAAGYALETSSVSSRDYPSLIPSLAGDDCAGMLVIATEMNQREAALLERLHFPLVILDTDPPYLPHSSVTMNNRKLAWQAVSCLASAGEVGYLRSSQATGNFACRAIGYREAVRYLGLPESDRLIYSITPDIDRAGDDMDRILDADPRVPRAFFADNDVIAIGCIRSMLRHGIRIPEDTQIIGVDNAPLSQVISPSLSSMQISQADIAQAATRLLLDLIEAPASPAIHIRTEGRLIRRQSILPDSLPRSLPDTPCPSAGKEAAP